VTRGKAGGQEGRKVKAGRRHGRKAEGGKAEGGKAEGRTQVLRRSRYPDSIAPQHLRVELRRAGTTVKARSHSPRLAIGMLALAWALFVLVVYCPDVGRGFIKDDFTWVRTAKAAIVKPTLLVLPSEPGFYRPVVAAAFTLDYAAHQWMPRWYGWTNLFLYTACVAAVLVLALTLGIDAWPAVVGTFLWAVNPHGINMAVLWFSGRTALCLTLFSVLSAILFLRQRYGAASLLILAALGSKEEAVLLPFILLACTWLRQRDMEPKISWKAPAASALVPLAVYFAFRSTTPSFTLTSAPSFYRISAWPGLVFANLIQYADRSATVVAIGLLIALIVYRRRPRLGPAAQPAAMMALWWIGMFAITMCLPVRSSLYAVCPSVGVALIGAMLVDEMRTKSTRADVVFAAALAAALMVAIPSYQLRNDRWVESARVSQRLLQVVARDAPRLPDHGVLVLDDRDEKPSNLQNAFGDLATEAMRTVFERDWIVRMAPVPEGAPDRIAEYRLDRGTVTRIR
jgi:hypothetical protein